MKTERTPAHVRENIAKIAKIEEECLERRSRVERIGDAIGTFSGSMTFVVLHLLWFLAWVLINTRIISWIPAFDPYPFIFLSMMVSLEAVLLSTFVLMKQNRMSKRADQRAHLDLQINLLTEREVTKNMQLLQRICAHLGLEEHATDTEVEALTQNTAVESLAKELQKTLPD